MEKYQVKLINIFEEPVFGDTTSTVCSFIFSLKNKHDKVLPIRLNMFPNRLNLTLILNLDNNYTFGGHLYKLPINSKYTVKRLTINNKHLHNSNILIRCIDSNINNMIRAEYLEDGNKLLSESFIKSSARSYLIPIINPAINKEEQLQLVSDFNSFLNKNRQRYHSLFLTNYRESNNVARKRISFNLVFEMINYLLE